MDAQRRCGFTLIELLAVMAVLATLLSLVAPRYFEALDRAKEAALRTDLRLLREAIDKHRADTGKLPESLHDLARARYLYALPVDPITGKADSWIVIPSSDDATPGVFDVRSGAPGTARDGSDYSTW